MTHEPVQWFRADCCSCQLLVRFLLSVKVPLALGAWSDVLNATWSVYCYRSLSNAVLMCKWRAIIVLVCRFCFTSFSAMFPSPFALIRRTRFLGSLLGLFLFGCNVVCFFFNLNCCAALQLLVLVQVNWPYLHFGPHHTSHAFVLPIVAFFSSSLKYSWKPTHTDIPFGYQISYIFCG